MKINAYKKNGATLYRFVAYIGVDPVTGKQKQVKRSGFKTQRDAKLAYAKITAEGDTKQLQKKKLYEVCDIWLSYYVSTVQGSTYQKTERQIDQHIKPFFGDVEMRKITPIKAQEFTNHIYTTLVNGSTVVSLSKRIFAYAKSPLRTIRDNPFDDVLRPKKKEKEIETTDYYTKEELVAFLQLAKINLSPMWYLFFHLMAYTGLRRGEELALTWKDIDFKNRTISVNKALTRDKDGIPTIGDPKNKSSKRVIEIDPVTTYKLRQWRYKNREEEYVFPNTKGSFTTFSQPWHQLSKLKSHDIKIISPHGFRHTHCSMLFSAGVPIHLVQSRLGHSDIKTTMNIYNHIYKSDEKKAVTKFMSYVRSRD